jgi:hypothetical protein
LDRIVFGEEDHLFLFLSLKRKEDFPEKAQKIAFHILWARIYHTSMLKLITARHSCSEQSGCSFPWGKLFSIPEKSLSFINKKEKLYKY